MINALLVGGLFLVCGACFFLAGYHTGYLTALNQREEDNGISN